MPARRPARSPARARAGKPPPPAFFSDSDVDPADLRRLIESATTDPAQFPLATSAQSGILLYDARALLDAETGAARAELARALLHGPGIFVVRAAFDRRLVRRISGAFQRILDEEAKAGGSSGDHFGKAGENSRAWSTLEKLARGWPELFVAYYSNEPLALACAAWLGPNYQVTSQLNVVRPGSAAQQPHRDYHLGFGEAAWAADYPAHAHAAISPSLTLQALIAHSDMPIESGPTCFLPHSHKYAQGYLATHRPDVQAYFEANAVQLSLGAGDLVCFNPAVIHAAGANRTQGLQRMANLLQVSSAFGRPMEVIDTARLTLAIYPAILDAARNPSWTAQHTANVIAAVAEGYPFPAMLDAAPPTSAEGRETEATLLATAIEQRWTVTELQRRLSLCESRHRPPRLPPPSVWAWALRPIAHALGVRDGWRGLADGVAKWALAAPGAAVRATRRAVARLVS